MPKAFDDLRIGERLGRAVRGTETLVSTSAAEPQSSQAERDPVTRERAKDSAPLEQGQKRQGGEGGEQRAAGSRTKSGPQLAREVALRHPGSLQGSGGHGYGQRGSQRELDRGRARKPA